MIRRHSQNIRPKSLKCEPEESLLALKLKQALEEAKQKRAREPERT